MQDQIDELKQLIENGLTGVDATVKGDGSHFEAVVVGDCFDGQSLVQKQKMVYATINDKITSGEVHAITIKAYTPDEWKKAQTLQVGGL